MVNFVLDDLGRPAGEGLDAGLELLILPLNLDRLIAFARPWAAQQGKTAFGSIVEGGCFDDLRVKHC